jgi:hypothetical protein
MAVGFFLPWCEDALGCTFPTLMAYALLSFASPESTTGVLVVWLIIGLFQLPYLVPVGAVWTGCAFLKEWPRRTAIAVWTGAVSILLTLAAAACAGFKGWSFGVWITVAGAIGLLVAGWLNAER